MSFIPRITTEVKKTINVPESKATVTIKHIKSGVMQGIMQSTMKVVAQQQENSDKMLSQVSFDTHAKNVAVVQECVIGWSGFKSESGKQLKFSQSSLADMIKESSEFVDFIVSEQETLDKEVEEESVAAEKN